MRPPLRMSSLMLLKWIDFDTSNTVSCLEFSLCSSFHFVKELGCLSDSFI